MIVDLEADTYVSGQTVDPCYKNLTWKRRNIGTSIVISVMDLHQGVFGVCCCHFADFDSMW